MLGEFVNFDQYSWELLLGSSGGVAAMNNPPP
jgi:hypothetical protein